eukprot:4581425-Pleurochrysis_carterae.AAC.1
MIRVCKPAVTEDTWFTTAAHVGKLTVLGVAPMVETRKAGPDWPAVTRAKDGSTFTSHQSLMDFALTRLCFHPTPSSAMIWLRFVATTSSAGTPLMVSEVEPEPPPPPPPPPPPTESPDVFAVISPAKSITNTSSPRISSRMANLVSSAACSPTEKRLAEVSMLGP